MKKLGEICSISYYALDKADVVIDEYTFSVVSKSLESVFKMVAAQEKNLEAQHSGGVEAKPVSQQPQLEMPCESDFMAWCGIQHYNQAEAASIYRYIARHNKQITPFRCPQCGKEHFPKQVYCDECCEGM